MKETSTKDLSDYIERSVEKLLKKTMESIMRDKREKPKDEVMIMSIYTIFAVKFLECITMKCPPAVADSIHGKIADIAHLCKMIAGQNED